MPAPSNWAMSSPSFVPERDEIWYSDGLSGFYAVRVTAGGPEPFGVGGPRRTCLAHRSPIGPRNVGRIRLGYGRRRLLRVPVHPVRRTRRAFRYCVRDSSGRVIAVFSRRGRVALVTTTAHVHGNRGVRPGSPARAFRRAYSRRRAVRPGVYRVTRGTARLIGVRKGGSASSPWRPEAAAESARATASPAAGRPPGATLARARFGRRVLRSHRRVLWEPEVAPV